MRRWSRAWWLRRTAYVGSAVLVFCLVMVNLDTQVSTAVGAKGTGEGSFPVVEVAGLGSDGVHFAKLTKALQSRGVTVLDFDPSKPGVQALTYEPRKGEHIPSVATRVVGPAIRDALARARLDPRTQVVDVVAHSMGGLLVRYLVEHPVDQWAAQVDDLVMVGTPNHGSSVIGWETNGRGPFGAVGDDMAPGSAFLTALGTREPPGEVYTTIGGDPWMFRWYRHGHHGFDDQVPSESPFLTGAANNTRPYLHGRLLRADRVVSLIVATLEATA